MFDALLLADQHYRKAVAEGRQDSYEFDTSKGGLVSYWQGKQPKRLQARCGARCRTGEPCKMRVVEGKRRCRLHGGLSTGAKTPEGRARIIESNRRRAKVRATAVKPST